MSFIYLPTGGGEKRPKKMLKMLYKDLEHPLNIAWVKMSKKDQSSMFFQVFKLDVKGT